jgi:WhiB family redox-sensing transcriptional regulator
MDAVTERRGRNVMAEVSWLNEYKTQAAGAPPAGQGPDVLGMAGVFDAGFPGMDPEDQGWQERALCAETDPEAFFPEKGGSTREAKKICTGCEVRSECLDFALANDERFGIWGGLSERERRRLRRRVG